jgi:hypothetical protein
MPTETTPAVPMTLEERTNALFTTVLVSPGSQVDSADLLRLHAGVVEALRTVRRETLEEAARVALTCDGDFERDTDARTVEATRRGVAAAICSLAVKEGEPIC